MASHGKRSCTMSALVSLVERAAVITKPYNPQDALLLIKALSTLRLSRPEVKIICEKSSFSLASSPTEVPTAVLVDAVNHLCTLQSAHLPVVQLFLLKRFCELQPNGGTRSPFSSTSASCFVDPRTVQKAALVLAKLGRNSGQAEATEHVLRLLHAALQQEPDDAGLHIAYVALYANSSRCTTPLRWWETTEPPKISSRTLQRSLAFLLENRQTLTRASGNVAWQLLHLLLVLPPSTQCAVSSQGRSSHLLRREQIEMFERFLSSGALAQKTSAGAYVHFVHAFGADVCRLELQRTLTLLTPLARTNDKAAPAAPHTPKRLNVYDATKLASALAAMFSVLATHPSRSTSPAALGSPSEQRPGFQVSEGSQQLSLNKHEAWLAVMQLCFTILCELVKSEQARLRSTRPGDENLINVMVSPDRFLVAALLDSYARGYAVVLESSALSVGRRDIIPLLLTSAASVSALLEFVPLLSELPPAMISWMLRSLASLRRQNGVDSAQLERSAAFLLRRYLCVSSDKRCLRSNVETLYAYARLVSVNGDVQGGRSFSSAPAAAVTPEKPPSHRLPALGALDSVIHEISLCLRVSSSDPAEGPPTADADMLLAALLHLHTSMSPAVAGIAAVPKRSPAVPPLLDQLQVTLAAYYCDRDSSAPRAESAADVIVRAARLHVLAELALSPQFPYWRSGAALAKAAERATEQVAVMPCLVSSASMLRALSVLGRGRRSGAATPLPPATFSASLLCTLCRRYQQCIGEMVQASGQREHVSELVRVFWRARLVGVQLVFAEFADEDVVSDASSILPDANASRPQLRFPACLCRLEHLTSCAAADVLHLIAEVQLSSPESVQLPPHTVHDLRTTLLETLATSADVECVIRLVQANATPAVSQAVFPHKGDLRCLLHCVETSISGLLHGAPKEANADSAKWYWRGDSREQASRLLHALAESQLFLRIPEIASGEESGGLRRQFLQLTHHLEGSARNADEVAMLKMRLLCGGVL
ncbi:hypothetical protein GH5_00566 [Leishmania sp. Ghana 2012 LV757]|uniref:hypothetical protein n=1 Tax=Leishmania sp. Ghana 2012 LV757 TaxID=2803181 RepID=UPI001B4DDC6B|nr:hypothetical protein GH5_00566 [Leishmania sp. Ghana 2012 LV757]